MWLTNTSGKTGQYQLRVADNICMQQNQQIESILRSHGLVCKTFCIDDLSSSMQKKLIDACQLDIKNCYLSLLANAGSQFWTSLKQTTAHAPNHSAPHSTMRNTEAQTKPQPVTITNTQPAAQAKTQSAAKTETHPGAESADNDMQANPVDDFSIALAKELIEAAQLDKEAQILYPGKFAVPLIALGELAGWNTPSPLGLGLHPTFGPWFAYRALILTTQPLQSPSVVATTQPATSPCLTCDATPCVSACPAQAVELHKAFNIEACADYRMRQDSPCQQQCHARNACPVGVPYRYSEEQRAYHMSRALHALVRWSNS